MEQKYYIAEKMVIMKPKLEKMYFPPLEMDASICISFTKKE